MRRKTKERHQSGGGNKQQQQQSKVKEETKQELAMRPTTDQQSNGTTTGTGGGGKTEDLLKANSENGELQAEVKDGNSRSPMPIRMPPVPTLQLHQRCGVPEAAENGGEEAPHSTKSLKHQQSNAASKAQVATIATGRIGPIAITVRASRAPIAPPSQQQNGGGGVDNGNDDDISIGGRHFYAMGSPQFQQQQQMNGEGGSAGSSSTSAQASEQSSALVKIEARKVNCKSSDGELFVVDWYLMQQSKLFKRCWEEHRLALKKKSGNGRSRKFVFGMDTVDAATFRLVIEWLVQHDGMDDPAAREDPVTGERMWFELTEFERRFFDQPIEIINNLLNAGKSLDITSLYLFGCQQMAAILQSKSPSAIREMLGLENDMSPSEIAAIRRRNRKFKMRELKAAKYADRLQQLQSQLGNMDTKAAIENANGDGDEAEADEDAGKQQRPEKKEKPKMVRHGKMMAERLMQDRLQQGKPLDGKLMAEQLMLATGRDILPKKNEE